MINIRKKANIIMNEVYEDKMFSFFIKRLKYFCNIDCFATLIILPNNEILHLSTAASHGVLSTG
ncbi:hypothetical protein AVI51_02545 [Piscirickettsia salmonis]|nr:hypothetical protein AVI48_13250 [Piscirickettsia salmonis]APS48606.1 hypothetical protein AVI49_13860 [Piscirickettsia salmonis]APS53048.1 hypothetical protein AVI51_02545 [Piscirickettsia salmonis]APS56125.1 hypothetical protein AVI52_02000 [Piscirickettsia salmonis]